MLFLKCFYFFYLERRRSCESHPSNSSLNQRYSTRQSDSSEHTNQPTNRKLDFDQLSTPATLKARRKASESDASYSRKQHDHDPSSRRRSVRSIVELIPRGFAASSSSSSDSEDDTEVQNLLSQSKNRLEHTEALRIRSHLLRPEDYVRENNLKELFSRKRVRKGKRIKKRNAKKCVNAGDGIYIMTSSSISFDSTSFTDDGVDLNDTNNHHNDCNNAVNVNACHANFVYILFWFVVCVIVYKVFKMMRLP